MSGDPSSTWRERDGREGGGGRVMNGREALISITSWWLHGLFQKGACSGQESRAREFAAPACFFFFLLCLPKLGQQQTPARACPPHCLASLCSGLTRWALHSLSPKIKVREVTWPTVPTHLSTTLPPPPPSQDLSAVEKTPDLNHRESNFIDHYDNSQ